MENKMEPLPYTVAVIKPDTASSQDKVNTILKKIEDSGLTIYERETRNLDKEDVANLMAKHKNKDFFNDVVDYMMSGPCEILLITQQSGDPVKLWKDMIGPSDPVEAKAKRPDSLRAQFGVNLLKNEFWGSDDYIQANRERDIFDLPIPVREPDFIFDNYKITLETLLKFIYPPHLEHPNACGRLDLVALYGPIVNHHSVDLGCFCTPCSRLAKNKLKEAGVQSFQPLKKGKLAEVARRLLHEQEIIDMWGEFCEKCRHHLDNYSHLPSGRSGQHLMTDIEINQLIQEMNKNEIEELLTAVKGNAAKIIIMTIDLKEPEEIQYSPVHIRELFEGLDKDYFQRMDFYTMQEMILRDRKTRMNLWVSKITGMPIESIPIEPSFKKPAAFGFERTLPLSVTHTDKPLTGTQRDPSIVDQPKLGPNAEKLALLKRMHREGFLIGAGKSLNVVDTANNVKLLRNYAPGRHGGWDNYFAIRHPGTNTMVYKKAHKK
jgi:nucleoside diphosphate kinase/thiol-disulfide isomerase/thioredoxin